MPEHEGGHVALFIDWDNLAISTAADHAGALPDLRRIVELAQSYGTVLLARAYAEWGVTSERLTVYRAGIEPVYAPTFRYEPDMPGQPSRGKSLADPCLVADCIDLMHLHPQMDTLMLVSGDKDLIPIVRLAQLRGKRVIVVGPDLVAAVLKDMADEYISYRSLVGALEDRAAQVRAEAAELGRRRRRRGGRGTRGAGDEAAPTAIAPTEPAPRPESTRTRRAPTERPAEGERPPRRRFADRAGVLRPPPIPAEPVAEEPEPSAEDGGVEPTPIRPAAAAAAPTAPAPAADMAPASPDELRDLWDAIAEILRERTNAGRPRLRATNLKDYLIARMPGFSERRYGFNRFPDLLAAAEIAGVLSVTEVGQVQWISLPGEYFPGESRTPAAPFEPATASRAEAPVSAAIVRQGTPEDAVRPEEAVGLITELRHRNRLLTQSYVQGTLTGLIGQRTPGADADAARRLLDRLEELGAIQIDREPQEVEFGGARHRVRLVRLVDGNPLVQRAESERGAPGAEMPTGAADVEPEAEAGAPSNGRARRGRRGGTRTRRTAEAGGGEEAAAPATLEPAGTAEAAPPPTEEPAATPEPEPAGNGSREAAFEALPDVVRASIPPGRDTAGAAGVKSRLTAALGTFDERELGFSKFKDFLVAAEKAGKIRVETAGGATRVGLPTS